jgi:tetratricopeptide (TPR) repeat protein
LGQINAQDRNYKELLSAYRGQNASDKTKTAFEILSKSDISDSLRNAVSKEVLYLTSKMNDTLYGTALSFRGVYHYKIGERDSAIWYYKKAIQRLKGTPKEKYNCIVYDNMALACLFTENAPIARKYLDTASVVLSRFSDSSYLGRNYFIKGIIERFDLDYTESNQSFEMALNISALINDTINLVKTLNALSYNYSLMGDYEKQKEILLKILTYSGGITEKQIANVYLNLGYNYLDYSDIEMALESFEKAIEGFAAISDKSNLGRAYGGIAEVYREKNDYSMALEYIRKSMDLYGKNDIAYGESLAMIANTYLDEGRYYDVKPYIDSAMLIYRQCNSNSTLPNLYILYAKYYSAINSNKIAILYFDSVASFIRTNKADYLYNIYYNSLITHFKKKGNYENAFKTLEKKMVYKDSVLSYKSKMKYEDLLFKYETERKEKENILLTNQLQFERAEKEKEKANHRVVIYSWIGTILLLLFLIIMFVMSRKNSQQRRKLNQERIKWLDQENFINGQLAIRTKEKLEANKNILKVTNNALLQQTQLAEKLLNYLKGLRPYCNSDGQKTMMSFMAEISSFSTESNWKTFEKNFTSSHPFFMKVLMERHPDLTTAEKRLCAFIKMGFDTAEISKITLQQKHSIYRLKKKLRAKIGIEDNNEALSEYIISISVASFNGHYPKPDQPPAQSS